MNTAIILWKWEYLVAFNGHYFNHSETFKHLFVLYYLTGYESKIALLLCTQYWTRLMVSLQLDGFCNHVTWKHNRHSEWWSKRYVLKHINIDLNIWFWTDWWLRTCLFAVSRFLKIIEPYASVFKESTKAKLYSKLSF